MFPLLDPLPPGRHGLPPELVAASQRSRLLNGVVRAVGEKSYASTTIADITNAADVSKKTFYAYFRDKEDCFLTAYSAFADLVLATIRNAFEQSTKKRRPWIEHYRASTSAYLRVMSIDPVRTRALMFEVLAAGPNTLRTRRKIMEQFEANLREVFTFAQREDPRLPPQQPAVYQLLIGGVDEYVRDYILDDRTEQLPQLCDAIVAHVYQVFTGQQAPVATPGG